MGVAPRAVRWGRRAPLRQAHRVARGPGRLERHGCLRDGSLCGLSTRPATDHGCCARVPLPRLRPLVCTVRALPLVVCTSNALNMTDEPILVAPTKMRVPNGFHSIFVPEAE